MQCEIKARPTQLTGPVKSMSSDAPDRWALVCIRINGDLEILSESRASKDEALAEAHKLADWWQVAGVGVAPLTIDLARMEVVKKPITGKVSKTPAPLEKAASDAERSFPAP